MYNHETILLRLPQIKLFERNCNQKITLKATFPNYQYFISTFMICFSYSLKKVYYLPGNRW